MERVLDNQVAVITGASTGIGFSIAKRFGAAGARIVVTSRSAEAGAKAERSLRDEGVEAVFIQADVAAEDDVRRLMDKALAAFGSINILVNNAGPNGDAFAVGLLHDLPSPTFDQAMRVGAYGPYWCCKYALPHMIAAGGGSVLNISSVAAVRALSRIVAYAMAKAALEALTRQVANDYAPYAIRCNSLLVGTVRPGPADVSTLPPGFDTSTIDATIAKTTMFGSVGVYDDTAAAALFLVSPEGRYITGVSLPVDGGALSKMQYPDYADALEG
jgi:NAD(P)-dependent dehydrogenase (short-subunit alcohol dehydrogenase family)